jgi:hypothetical protein
MVKSYTQKEFEKDLEELETLINNQNGGVSSNYEGKIRHFKVVMLNNEEVDFGRVDIKDHQNPSKAAKKLLGSIATHKNLTKLNKLKLNVVFMIKETTRDSKQKIYGPYKGKYVKLTPEEMKKATRAGITFTMRPSVKLHKEKLSPMKGGGATCSRCGHWHTIAPSLSCGGCGASVSEVDFVGNFNSNKSSKLSGVNKSLNTSYSRSIGQTTGSVAGKVGTGMLYGVGALAKGMAGHY